MSKYRPNRLAETLKEEVSQLIRVELKDPRIGFVTVTSVEGCRRSGSRKSVC